MYFGLGRLAKYWKKNLENEVDVIAVDKDEEKINAYMNLADYAICAERADESVLQEIGVKNVDQAFVSIWN